MALKTKTKNLADTINALINVVPTNYDSDDGPEETRAKVVDRYDESDNSDDYQQSSIRKQNVDLLDQVDKRYEGKKVSRNDIWHEDSNTNDDMENDESDDAEEKSEMEDTKADSEDDISDDEDDSNKKMLDSEDSDGFEDSDDADGSKGSDDSDGTEGSDDGDNYDISNPLYRERRTDANFKTMSDTNVKSDVEKGNCAISQLKIWESLIEMRIKLQKCLMNSNQMPQYDAYNDFKSDTDFIKKTNETKDKLKILLDNMLNLQSSLLRQYPETKKLDKTNKEKKSDANNSKNDTVEDPMDEEIPSDTEDEEEDKKEDDPMDSDSEEVESQVPHKKLKLSGYEKVLQDRHNCYKEYRNSIIQKWNDKTRIATGNINKGTSQTALLQIEYALNNKDKLRKRTQLKRSEYNILGKPLFEDNDGRRVQEYDNEIYDDDDFYHQLLRDLIEYKSSNVTDPIQLSKQWIQLQNMRNKMKRKIDTRATKGRRIRYDVHNKLVNFMAPITVYDTWTDLAKDDLYNSLFGKTKSAGGQVVH